ncbi:haloacid dehalogenase [Streptococcus equi subsp. zooepidemicus Sz105]|uniref:Cof-type HAD-IIB family hydrolase n=1 Tax=Streptococcus equi TaxID=1336 RepID=UPI0005BD1E2B|nr:Cof-type HAD-IIB family hydrolase [Streptococcus equi]KIS14347.1 haloacid dehalogenase [Streptococcus equi subsp. zooepidemicus Sz105]MDI5918490.1 Cof-type HAD-IIB family hydrolase [Streptococcus equi subsp. zooepidemicus]MDI5956635.1 Cof-type HAD-IIB family hydrolase [Streptococcus equi subsp. zooepidemicus]MDI5988704.1 Cof-type HAD-IIB family hydrolase [Streptococcus equi subsp. zooepidemicus]QTR94382.1 Sugar phosphatase YidA [Streptococcus equi subsp. zooepidemicus]
MIQLIAIDLDGTLLDSKKHIPKENIKAIQAAAREGIKVVLCTGRPQSGTRPYFEQLGLSDKEEYLILNNGCSTYRSPSWELLHYQSLTFSAIEHLYQLSQPFSDIYLTLTGERDYLVIDSKVPDMVQADGDLVFTKVKATNLSQLSNSSQIIFQAMYMGEKAALDTFEALVREKLSASFSVVRSQETILEVMPECVTKASALKELTADLRLRPDQVMAIGDAANDLEMLAYAGLGVAMGNADEAIKKVADKVSLSNDQAGVAHAINQFALKKGS